MAARKPPIRIITISRDYGSGGSEIAQILADSLGWPLIDRALIQEAARRVEAPEAEVAAVDEHVGGIVERIAGVFARGTPEAPVMGALPDCDMVAEVERAVLRDALTRLPFILVGHGGQCVFSGRPDALHVRIVGPLGARIRRIAERRGLDPATAARETERHDAERRRYIRHHFDCDANDAGLYGLQINTGVFTPGEAASLILQTVGWREASVEVPVPVQDRPAQRLEAGRGCTGVAGPSPDPGALGAGERSGAEPAEVEHITGAPESG